MSSLSSGVHRSSSSSAAQVNSHSILAEIKVNLEKLNYRVYVNLSNMCLLLLQAQFYKYLKCAYKYRNL